MYEQQDVKTISGKIERVEQKRSGVNAKNNRPWTLYIVHITANDGADIEFETFDGGFIKSVGKTGSFFYKIDEREFKGRTYESFKLLPFESQNFYDGIQETHSVSTKDFSSRDKKLDDILSSNADILSVLDMINTKVDKLLHDSLGDLE